MKNVLHEAFKLIKYSFAIAAIREFLDDESARILSNEAVSIIENPEKLKLVGDEIYRQKQINKETGINHAIIVDTNKLFINIRD